MPAATLGHIKYTPQAIALCTASNILTAVYNMLTSANDYAGNPIAKPLTVNREGTTTAVYWSYFEGLSSVRGIVAGDGATSPSMRSPDTAVPASYLYVGCNKGSIGAYGTWATSPVFAGSTFSSYWRGFELTAGNPGTLYGWSSGETVWLTLAIPFGATTATLALGSLWDPGTSDSPSGETGSTLNGMSRSTNDGTAWVTSQAPLATGPLDHATANGNKHTMAWDGGSTATTSSLPHRDHVMVAVGANVRKNKNGDIAATPFGCRDQSTGQFIGRVREVYYSVSAVTGQVLQLSGVDKGYFAGGRGSIVEDCFLLKAA